VQQRSGGEVEISTTYETISLGI